MQWAAILLFGIILLVCVRAYDQSDLLRLKCIISDVDGNKYCVRDRALVKPAVDKLARVSANLGTVVEHVYKKYPERSNCLRLHQRFDPSVIRETLPTSKLTAYSENKGEKIAFCLNKRKENNEELIDDNTLMFVALHELAHVASETLGHNDEFWSNFRFLIKEAVGLELYTPLDYSKYPKSYCGMNITDNPHYS